MNDLKGTKECKNRKKRQSNNSVVIKQNPSSSSRDRHNNISLSSAGTQLRYVSECYVYPFETGGKGAGHNL